MPTGANSTAMWKDPDPGTASGVLLSDRIELYVAEVNLIAPFDTSHLGPASYDLSLGEEYSYSTLSCKTGQTVQKLKEGENLILPPNSMVFVTAAEALSLPFYLIARFNLKLRLLHEGLLMGVGPQVDPGFVGRLSCPLHNISNNNVSLCRGETFAVLEFQKTSPFGQSEEWNVGRGLHDVRRDGEKGLIKGVLNASCKTFPERSLNRPVIKGYLPAGKVVSSSIFDVVEELTKLKNTVDSNLTRLNHLAFITVAVVAVSLAAVGITLGTYFYASVNWQRAALDAAHNKVAVLESSQARLEARQEITERLLRASNQAPPDNAAPSAVTSPAKAPAKP